jgi:hypothetical protein
MEIDARLAQWVPSAAGGWEYVDKLNSRFVALHVSLATTLTDRLTMCSAANDGAAKDKAQTSKPL